MFISGTRLNTLNSSSYELLLDKKEVHYLKKVLRLKQGDFISIVDGEGHLWDAQILDNYSLELESYLTPKTSESKNHLQTWLAVVPPKNGFEEILRMSCEIGIDVIQPLNSKYIAYKGNIDSKFQRWEAILRESHEQSERLWLPELRNTLMIEEYLTQLSNASNFSMAVTREKGLKNMKTWLNNVNDKSKNVCVLIGPEGGWDQKEIHLAINAGVTFVNLGENILRTSTAAIIASYNLVSWRNTLGKSS